MNIGRRSLGVGILFTGLLLAGCATPTTPAPTAVPTIAIETGANSHTNEAFAIVANDRFSLNTATDEELLGIPNMDRRIVRELKERRPYTSIAHFRQEMGEHVDAAQAAAYEKHLFVPVAYNDSDAPTLQQLPGVTEEIAEALIDGRPYADQAAFLTALARRVSAEQAAAAPAYMVAE